MRADSDIFVEKQEYPRNSSTKTRKLGQPDAETNDETIIKIVLFCHREGQMTNWTRDPRKTPKHMETWYMTEVVRLISKESSYWY